MVTAAPPDFFSTGYMSAEKTKTSMWKEFIGRYDVENVAAVDVGNPGARAPVGCDYVGVPCSPSGNGQVFHS